MGLDLVCRGCWRAYRSASARRKGVVEWITTDARSMGREALRRDVEDVRSTSLVTALTSTSRTNALHPDSARGQEAGIHTPTMPDGMNSNHAFLAFPQWG